MVVREPGQLSVLPGHLQGDGRGWIGSAPIEDCNCLRGLSEGPQGIAQTVARQEAAGTVLAPEPMNPNVVLAPAAKAPL